MSEPTVKLALTALKRTAVVPVKFVPLIVTLVPVGPLAGVKAVIVGGGVVVVVIPDTITSCSTLAVWDSASVMVSRTYLVPVLLNVKDIVAPVPNTELSASSVQL